MVSFVGSRNFSLFPMVTVYPTKRGDTNWYRPPQTRYGAHVASQRCTILRSGKAIILCRNTQLMATPKTQIVLDMGYTLSWTRTNDPFDVNEVLWATGQVVKLKCGREHT